MASRATILEALRAKVAALLPGVTVELYDGDDRIFNDDASFPHAAVALSRISPSPLLEVGADPGVDQATYVQGFEFEVILATCDTDPDTLDGYGAGLAYLDTLEAGLNGHHLASPQKLTWTGEELLVGWLGRYEWSQTFRTGPLISR